MIVYWKKRGSDELASKLVLEGHSSPSIFQNFSEILYQIFYSSVSFQSKTFELPRKRSQFDRTWKGCGFLMTHVFLQGMWLGGNGWLRGTWAQLTGQRWCRCHTCTPHRQLLGHCWVSSLLPTHPKCTRLFSISGCIFPTLCCWSCFFTSYSYRLCERKGKCISVVWAFPSAEGMPVSCLVNDYTTTSALLKQKNAILNAVIWEVGVSSPCFKSDKEFEPLFR